MRELCLSVILHKAFDRSAGIIWLTKQTKYRAKNPLKVAYDYYLANMM